MRKWLSIAVGICCLCALAENPKGNSQIVSRVSDTKVRPVIDGTVNAEEWADAAILMPFSMSEEAMQPLQEKHLVYLKYDSDNLYLAVQTRMDFDPAIVRYKDDDMTMKEVDSLQIILERPGEHFWYSFLIERAGGKCDWRFYYWDIKPSNQWNPEWKYACRNVADTYFEGSIWEGEVAIPWAALEMEAPKEKTAMQAQFFRYHGNKRTTSVGTRMSSWGPLNHHFNMPVSEGIYGTLEFMPGRPVFRPECKFDNFGKGFGSFKGEYTGEKATFAPRVWDIRNYGNVFLQGDFPIDNHRLNWRQAVPMKERRLAMARYQVTDEFGTVARFVTRVTLDQPFSADVQPIYSTDEIVWNGEITLDSVPLDSYIIYEIQDKDGKTLKSDRQAAAKWFEERLSIAEVPVGDAVAVAKLVAADGKTLYTIRTPFKQIEKPEWMNANYGKVMEAFAPWRPMTFDIHDGEATLGVYKHNYRFTSESPLPSDVTMFGEPFAADSWRFVLTTNHGPQILKATAPLTASDKDGRGVTIHWRGDSKDVRMQADIRVEFDALSWYDVRLSPLSDGVEITDLHIDIPLRRKGLRYIRGGGEAGMDNFSEAALIGDAKVDYELVKLAMPRVQAVSPHGWKAGWRGCTTYWVGGEDRGFTFALPSLKNMNVKKDYSAVIENEKEITVRFNLVDTAKPLDAAIRYEFAIVLTPAKDKGDWPSLRKSGQSLPGEKGWNEDYTIPSIIAPNQHNNHMSHRMMRYGGEMTFPHGYFANNFLPCWFIKDCQTGNPRPRESEVELIRKMCAGYRKSGCRPYLWYDTMVTTLTPNPPTEYLADIRRYPIQNHPIETFATSCCPNGCWTDFYLYGALNRIKDGVGSIYTDMSSIRTCSNRFHGCGVRNPDGTVTPEYPLLAVREFYLRLQKVLKSNDPGGIVGMHAGVLEWSNHWIDINIHGEEWTTVFDYDTFTPELYQTLYGLQHAFGTMSQHFAGLIYKQYAAVQQKTKVTQEEIMGLCLVHGDTIFPSNGCEIHGNALVWNALDDFGADRDDTEWIPYWRNPLSKYPAGVLVSSWKRDGKELLVIFNFSKKELPLTLPDGKYYDTLRQINLETPLTALEGRRMLLLKKE